MNKGRLFAFVLIIAILFVTAIPVFAATNTVIVTPSSTDWVFVNDNGTSGDWATGFENGPDTPPIGAGSAFIQLNSAGAGIVLATQKYQGTRLADITTLSYSTYTNLSPAAMTFQINYDPDVTTIEAATWYGRLVYEPYQNNTVENNKWQTWDMLDSGNGKWWASNNGNSLVDNTCPQSAPCTLTALLAAYPNIGIRNDALSAIQFKAGSAWNGFDGNVDNFTFETGGNTTTYNFELDETPPTVASSDPVNGTTFTTGPTSLTITYSEDVKSDSSAGAANTISNYLLVEAGTNSTFNTVSCSAGLVADDVKIAINSISYDTGTFAATLNINGGTALPAGSYKLFVCGTTSIEDIAGYELNDGVSDTQISFTVSPATTPTPSVLPATGFAMGQVTILSAQPENKAYTSTEMTLEIPSIGVNMPIVGVPQSENGWDVSWLGNNAGYLAGSAFPTWAGNTVITGHVWDAYNQPGAFAEIKTLKYGDLVQIKAWGLTHTYEVRESKLVTTKNVNAAFEAEEYDWVTLVTCEFYNPFSGDYLFRRTVRAVLVSVK